MTKYIPPGFDSARIIDGLHRAMGFGEATRTGDKATFYTRTLPATTATVDQEGLPYDPDAARTPVTTSVAVPCAIEYFDRNEDGETFGVIQPTRIKVTLLDPDYQKVKGFTYVVAGGDRYYYAKTEPPIALGSIDVWIIHCNSQDET